MLWCQQQENKVYWVIVRGLKVDRSIQTCEDADDIFERLELNMRHRDATPKPCLAQTFTLKQRIKYVPLRNASHFGCMTCKFLEGLFLCGRVKGRNNTFLRDEITKIHCSAFSCRDRNAARASKIHDSLITV